MTPLRPPPPPPRCTAALLASWRVIQHLVGAKGEQCTQSGEAVAKHDTHLVSLSLRPPLVRRVGAREAFAPDGAACAGPRGQCGRDVHACRRGECVGGGVSGGGRIGATSPRPLDSVDLPRGKANVIFLFRLGRWFYFIYFQTTTGFWLLLARVVARDVTVCCIGSIAFKAIG